MIKKIASRFLSPIKGLITSLRKWRNASDYKKWGSDKNLSPDWDSRTEKLAKLIDADSSVIEFGAGRLVLKKYLSAGCSYTPSDLVDRGQGTIVCDLNSAALPQFQRYDFAVFSGVLEYVNDVPRLISHLSNYVNAIVTSYTVTDLNAGNRRAKGWVNEFSSKELIKLFDDAGFQCDHIDQWNSQLHSHLIYRFRKKPSISQNKG